MRIAAHRRRVEELETTLQDVGPRENGWATAFAEPLSGERWLRVRLGAEHHGGGLSIMVKEPMPTAIELVELAAASSDQAEIAACAWLLSELDPEGRYKEHLLAVAEEAVRRGDEARAVLLVGWAGLHDPTNLRSALGKRAAEVTSDHEHFKAIASRARALLGLRTTDQVTRDQRVFGVKS